MVTFPKPYRLRNIGRGRYSDRNASQIPDGAARDSLNLLHGVDSIQAKVRQAVDRAWKTRPASPGNGTLGTHELIRSDATSAILSKIGTALFEWTYAGGMALTSILTGMHATHQPGFATMSNRAFIADRAANYISNATGATTIDLQKSGSVGSMTLGHRVGTAVGNAAGTISYWAADVEPLTGMEAPPIAVTTIARLADEGTAISVLTYTAPYTSKKIYRNTVGDSTVRLVTTLTGSTTSYADDSLDTALTTVSTVHDANGVISIEKPEAAQHVCVWRNQLVLANLSGYPSRFRVSRISEPTQFENFTWCRRDVDPNDGDEITGVVPFKGSLIVFKKRSIYVVNGDVNPKSFVVSLAYKGIGAIAARSIVVTDTAIYFLTEGLTVFRIDLSNPPIRVGARIDGDIASLKWSSADRFCAGYNRLDQLYMLSVTPSGGSANTKTHVLNIETGAWGRFDIAGGKAVPTCYAELRNTDGDLKAYVGDANGYLYEFNAATGADGVTSGTKTGTATAGAATTVTVGAATFFTTGDTLKGLNVTIKRAADSTYETQEIVSNTGTVITVADWTGADPVAGDTVWVGAIDAQLSLNRLDMGSVGYKFVQRANLEWEKQSHATAIIVGFTVDGDTAPTSSQTRVMNTGYRGGVSINRQCVGVSLYFRIVGTDAGFDLLGIEMLYRDLDRRLPTR